MSTLLSAALAPAQDDATLDAGELFSALLLLGYHAIARGWPAQRWCGRRQQGGRDDPRVTDCLRSRRQLLESSVPRVDEPAATS